MKVSYLLGLYNKENYIIDCVESILSEHDNTIEIEVCIVNDGSTDNSQILIEEKYKFESRVKIYNFEKNLGKNSAYNKAFQLSTGNFICIFGADDKIVPGRTRRMIEYSIKTNNAVYGGLIAKDQKLNIELFRLSLHKPSFYEISIQNSLSGGCCLIPRAFCDLVFPIPDYLKFEDWWVSYNLILNNKVSVIKDYVTYYRIGENNDSSYTDKDLFSSVRKDYLRHLDYITAFKKIVPNDYLNKSLDLRLAFFNIKPSKIWYFSPFDKISIKILFFYYFGAKTFYKIISLLR